MVALVANNLTDQTTLLNITGKTANKYRIEFGKEKSKILKIRRRKEHISLKLTEMIIDQTEHYKYLGETLKSNNNMNRPITINKKLKEQRQHSKPLYS